MAMAALPACLPSSLPARNLPPILCSATNRFRGPKSGAVGSQRFKESAAPGTYWSETAEFGEEVRISFNKGSEMVACTARVGENLLRVAERCQVMTPNSDFCFEGSCCHCEMEVVGGAKEVGGCAATKVDELIRSCICPVPVASGTIQVNLVNEDDVWGEQVV